MYDGLWVIDFKTEVGIGSGVLVFNGTQVMGGDYGYYYSGQINTTGNMSGKVNVIRFNQNAISVFGNHDSFTLLVKIDQINKASFTANATIEGAEHLSIGITGKKKIDTNEAS